jgi:guanylate kinase
VLANHASLLFCLCAPSGSGKSTISSLLLKQVNTIRASISTTTRTPRPGEVNGVDYYFVSADEFEERVRRGHFIEHMTFNGRRYGIERRNVEDSSDPRDVLFTIDVQGIPVLRDLYGSRVITIFVFPPSFAVLEQRLRARGALSETQISERLEIAKRELPILLSPEFSDFLVINNTLDQSVLDVASIVRSERCRVGRYSEDELVALTRHEQASYRRFDV